MRGLRRELWIWKRIPSHSFCTGTVCGLDHSGARPEEQSLNVFKILGLFRDRNQQHCHLGATQVLGILQESSWESRLEEVFQQQSLSPVLVEEVIKNCNEPNKALDFFQWSAKQDSCVRTIHAYNCLLQRLVDSGLLSQAQSVWDDMNYAGFSPDVHSYCLLIRGLFKAGKFDTACSQLDKMLDKGLVPNAIVYNNLISCLCKAGKLAEAEFYLKKRMPQDCSPDVISYNIIIDGYCKALNFDKAFAFLSEMLGLGHSPTPHAYSSLIAALCKAGNVTKAVEVFEEMATKEYRREQTRRGRSSGV